MFFLLLILHSKSETISYSVEGWNTLNSTQSPATIKFAKGLALMMVSWPDATIKINIPGVLPKPVTLTPKDKYSLFTFANNSNVEIVFSSKVTFFVFECPQYNSYWGAIQYCSNLKQTEYSINRVSKDLYYSVFGPYKMTGSISLSILGSAKLYYWISGNTTLTTEDLSPLKLPTICFTSALIRSNMIVSVSYKSLTLKCNYDFTPTVPTNVELEWSSVYEGKNNFLQNMAYGGSKDSNLISNLISDIPTESSYSLSIAVDKQLSSSSTIEVDAGDGKKTVSQNFVISRVSSFTAKLYMTYGKCKSTLFKTIYVNSIGVKTINLTVSDIPKECSESEYNVEITISTRNSFTFGMEIDGVMISKQNINSGLSILGTKQNHPFTLSLYLKYKYCTQMTKFKEFTIIKAGKTAFSISESDFPDECVYEKKNYYVNVKNELSSKIEQAILIIIDRNGNEKVLNQGDTYTDSVADYKSFSIQVYVQTKYCEMKSVKVIHATDNNYNLITFDDSIIPEQCLPYMICLSADVESDYSIGYEDLSSSSTEIIQLNDELNIHHKDSFEVQLYLIKSPSCQNNYKLDKYTAQKKIECKKISMKDIPSECLPVYYEVCFDLSNLPSKYTIYYLINDDKQMFTLTEDPIKYQDPFKVTLYLSESPGCSSIYLKTYNAAINPKCFILTDEDIPQECREKYFYVIVKNIISSNEHKLYALDRKNSQYIEIQKSEFFNDSDTTSFSLSLYMKSPYCEDYTFIDSLSSSRNKVVSKITDIDIPFQCQRRFGICVNLASMPRKYKIVYSLSYKSFDMFNAIYGENLETYNEPFTLHAYLIESPGCNEKVSLGEFESSISYPCIEVSESIIPESCQNKDISPNENAKSKGISTPLIAGISGVAVVAIIIAVVTTIFIIRKKNKNNNQFDSNSQTLNSNLLIENSGSANNF